MSSRNVLALAAGLLLALALPVDALDLQGHRGARGLAPENTLPAFALALGLGVDTLEL
jgi:glycerophosphoryl diester phosphodiesterase